MQNVASAFFSLKRRQKDRTSSLFLLLFKLIFNYYQFFYELLSPIKNLYYYLNLLTSGIAGVYSYELIVYCLILKLFCCFFLLECLVSCKADKTKLVWCAKDWVGVQDYRRWCWKISSGDHLISLIINFFTDLDCIEHIVWKTKGNNLWS